MNLLLDYFQNRQETILNSIREIVEIESASRDVGGSREVVDWLETETLWKNTF